MVIKALMGISRVKEEPMDLVKGGQEREKYDIVMVILRQKVNQSGNEKVFQY